MYSMVAIVINAVLYTWNLLRVDLKHSHQNKKGTYMRLWMC